jgi:tetratricopeptide (TPR) repeat protein
MEALFSTQLASYEAWLMLLCIFVFIGIYVFDGITFVRKVITAFTPQPPVLPIASAVSDTGVEVVSPMLEEITPAEIQAHEEEKETQILAEEVEMKKLDEDEAKLIEEIEHTEDEKIEPIQEDPILEEVTPESETIVEAPESSLIPAEVGIQSEEENTTPEILKSIPEPIIEPSIEKPEVAPVRREKEGNVEKLYLITNEVKTLIARWQTLEARALIIQGLSLDKNHRELNLILGSLYESDRQSQKAEYVYKDLAISYPDDVEILEKLANILIIEKRYDIAMEIYKKIISLAWENEGSLYIMTHLSHELAHHEELYAYARRYQKNWPNNPEILWLLAEAEVALGQRQDAIQTLIKLKNLTPYNSEIMDMIAKLTTDEELAGNFGG